MGVLWSWEQDCAVFGDVQLVRAGSSVLDSEACFADNVSFLARESRLERVSTYRQLQAVSNMLCQLTTMEITLDSFLPPPGLLVRAVNDGEVRVIRREQGRSGTTLGMTNDYYL